MRQLRDNFYTTILYLGIFITISTFLFIVGFIFVNGISTLSFDFVFGINKKEGDSMLPAIVNTLIIIGVALSITVPIGVSSAIYLNEYSNKDSKFVKFIRLTTESLAGIPSVIFGLFGFIFFVLYLKLSWSLLSGSLTVSMIILPTIIKSTEEALKSVPNSYREGSYALGVGKLYTIVKIIIPSAISGIVVGIILSVGRIVGESAALYLTAGTVMRMPESLHSSGSTLTVFMYTLTSEGRDYDKSYSVAIVIIIIVLSINLLTTFIAKKIKKG